MNKKVKMKPVKAWAVITPRGKLLEIARTWRKAKIRGFWNAPSVIVPVEIRELHSQKKKR